MTQSNKKPYMEQDVEWYKHLHVKCDVCHSDGMILYAKGGKEYRCCYNKKCDHQEPQAGYLKRMNVVSV